MCLPKALGGLGIRSLERLNIALLGRLGWMLIIKSPSLWVSICNAKYLRHGQFWDASRPRHATWVWHGVLRLLPHLRAGACRQICNGATTRIWQDPWVLGLPDFSPRPRAAINSEWSQEYVSSLISPSTQQWDRQVLHQCFDEDTVYHILRLPLHLNSSSDRWIWVLDKSGRYSTKSMYNHLVPPFNEAASPLNEQQWKALWKLKVHARLHLLLWKIAWNILPTRTRIAAIISSGAPPNCLCGMPPMWSSR